MFRKRGSTPNSSLCWSMSSTNTDVGARSSREESRRALGYRVGALEFAVLLLELGDSALVRPRRAADQTVVDVGLTHPGLHALEAVAELIGDPLDGPVTRSEFVAQRPHETDGLRLPLGAVAPPLGQGS